VNRLPGLVAALALLTAGCSASDEPPPPAATSAPASAAPTPTFTDVSRGDTESVVKLLKYDARALAVVVEPTVFLDGTAFCTAFGIPGTDPRCERDWVTEDSKTKVTLPLGARAKLLTVRDGDPECIDERTGAGACSWAPAELARRAAPADGILVRLTTEDGTATRIAEVYLP
jgi:hypothetical protein